MQTRKSGILALVFGAAVLGACEQKAPIVNIPSQTPATTVTIAGAPTSPIKKGATVQLVAIVANNANQAVTWSLLSGTGVVTVSATGLVTAVAPGTAVVQAVSQADATAKAAVSIQVQDTTTGTVTGQPSITISSVTAAGNLNSPVNPGNVAGAIDVTLNVDIPAGVNASAVITTIDGTEVCRQSFNAGGSADAAVEGSAVPQVITCSINTARLGTNGVAAFLNGTHTLKAQILSSTGTPVATATYQPLTFNNIDVINAVVTTSKGPAVDQNNLSWRGGDVVFTLTPAIYSGTANTLSTVTVSLTNSGAASMEGTGTPAGCASTGRALPLAGCTAATVTKTATTSTNNAFTVTFPASSNFAAGTGVGNIEDPNLTATVSGLTSAGQNFGGNVAVVFNNGPITNGTAFTTNQLRLDNEAPRVTKLDITPATLGCAPNAACYVNGAFAFSTSKSTYSSTSTSSTFSNTVDYGVDMQTVTFGAASTAAAAPSNTVSGPGALAESAVSNTYFLSATAVDALANSRTVYATTVAATPSTTAGGANQQFGVDLTPPTQTVSGNGSGVATATAPGANNTFTFTASDAGVGPSAIKQFIVKVEQIQPTGTTCLTPAGALYAGTGSCGGTAAGLTTVTAAGNPAAATVTLPDASAYYRITVTAQDYAGNSSTATTVVQLRDFVPPTAGGMATPSSITGGATASFSAPLQDDLDLGDLLPTIGYQENAVNVYLAQPRATIGTYGFDVFSTTDPGVFTVANFVRSIETTGACVPSVGGAACAPSGVISRATIAQADVRDVAGVQLGDVCPAAAAADGSFTQNCFQRNGAITSAIAFGIGGAGTETSYAAAGRQYGTGVNNGGTFFGETTSTGGDPAANTNVCSNNPVGANAGCNVVTTTSITLWAQAKGPSQTFANPFASVTFYAIDPLTGRSFPVCVSGAPSAVDNTVNNTRTWTYSCTWTPTAASPVPSAAGVYQTFALGVDASGRGLMSQQRQVTLTSD